MNKKAHASAFRYISNKIISMFEIYVLNTKT